MFGPFLWEGADVVPSGEPRAEILNGRLTYRALVDWPTSQTLWLDAAAYYLARIEIALPGETVTVKFDRPKINQPIPDSVVAN